MDEIERLVRMRERRIRGSERIDRTFLPMQDVEEVLAERERMLRRFMGPTYYSAHLNEIISQYETGPRSLSGIVMAGLEGRKWEQLLARFEAAPGLMGLFGREIEIPSEVWGSSLSSVLQRMQDVRLPDRDAWLADRLLGPFNGYSGFARDTLTRIADDPDAEAVAALSGSLVLAEEQVTESAALIEATLVEPEEAQDAHEPDEEDEDDSASTAAVGLLQAQQSELLLVRAIPEDATYDQLLTLSPTARLARTARRIGQRMVDCNELAREGGKEDVFKLTNVLLEALVNLAWVTARDKPTLGTLVDYLYFMLYEAAGKDHLRYLEYVDIEDCTVVWSIKHLRNKWLRHDPEHGDAGKIRRAYRDRDAAFRTLQLAGQPTSPAEFQALQTTLFAQVEQFLEHLIGRIKAR